MQTVASTAVKFNDVTLMSVVSATGRVYNIVFFPAGSCIIALLTMTHKYIRTGFATATFNSVMLSVWTAQYSRTGQSFVSETTDLRSNVRHIILIIKSYSVHVLHNTLNYMKEKRIVVFGLLAHNLHILQTLDVIVFSSFKSAFCSELHKLARANRVGDAFYMANVFSIFFETSHTIANIRRWFKLQL